eukprot:12583233-Alexandrium_andersonii.AAC.1
MVRGVFCWSMNLTRPLVLSSGMQAPTCLPIRLRMELKRDSHAAKASSTSPAASALSKPPSHPNSSWNSARSRGSVPAGRPIRGFTVLRTCEAAGVDIATETAQWCSMAGSSRAR